jgi:hypothetical protein
VTTTTEPTTTTTTAPPTTTTTEPEPEGCPWKGIRVPPGLVEDAPGLVIAENGVTLCVQLVEVVDSPPRGILYTDLLVRNRESDGDVVRYFLGHPEGETSTAITDALFYPDREEGDWVFAGAVSVKEMLPYLRVGEYYFFELWSDSPINVPGECDLPECDVLRNAVDVNVALVEALRDGRGIASGLVSGGGWFVLLNVNRDDFTLP